jgi:hypothetical protein
VGKLVAAFVFFLAASALAVHEAKPPPPPRVEIAPPPVPAEAPPSRAIHDEAPPWVKYAAPTAVAPPRPTPPPAPTLIVTQIPQRRVFIEESTIEIGDIPDSVDRCPDQPNDSDDNDGCPEPIKDRIIEIE